MIGSFGTWTAAIRTVLDAMAPPEEIAGTVADASLAAAAAARAAAEALADERDDYTPPNVSVPSAAQRRVEQAIRQGHAASCVQGDPVLERLAEAGGDWHAHVAVFGREAIGEHRMDPVRKASP